MIHDSRSSRTLRRQLHRELGPSATHVGELGAGELRALRRARLRELDVPPRQPLRREPEPEREERAPEATAVHWIEIALIGEDDQPVAGVRYRIELPDGRVRSGRLDHEGKARIDGIKDAGDCNVTFPDLDQDAWVRA